MRLKLVALLSLVLLTVSARTAAGILEQQIFGYNNYKNIMWRVIAEEPCLRELAATQDVERAELIFLLHQHVNQFPLNYFCENNGAGPVREKKDIELFFDTYTRYALPDVRLGPGEGGVGVVLFMTSKGSVEIVEVAKGGTAEEAGLQRYDRVLSVDKVPVRDVFQATKLILGTNRTEVSFVILRGGKIVPIKVMRERADFPDVDWTIFPSANLGYLKVDSFAYGIAGDVFNGPLKDFERNAVRGVILDLRANPGGYNNEANTLLGYFLGSATAFLEMVPALGKYWLPVSTTVGDAANREWLKRVPMVVLVDRYTASSAEIVATCLHFHKRALIVGEQTSGKGSVQHGIILNSGKRLWLTMGMWFTPDRSSIDKRGFVPPLDFTSLIGLLPSVDVAGIDRHYARDRDLMNAVAYFDREIGK